MTLQGKLPYNRVQQHELRLLEIGFGWRFEVDAQPDLDRFTDLVEYRVRGFVWEEQLDRHEVKYPADWLEAVKLRFAPRWLLARYPVRWTTKVFQASVLYPNFQRPAQLGQHVIRIVEVNNGH